MGYHNMEHIYLVFLKYLNVFVPMKPTTHGYQILIYISENLSSIDCRWAMSKLSRLSMPSFYDVTYAEASPSVIKVSAFIFYGLNHFVVCLNIFSIIGGEMTTTLTRKHEMRVIHLGDNPLNHLCTCDDQESSCAPMYPGPLDVDIRLHIFHVLSKSLLHECFFYTTPRDLSRLINEELCICIYWNDQHCYFNSFHSAFL